jgi:hypothetical protein
MSVRPAKASCPGESGVPPVNILGLLAISAARMGGLPRITAVKVEMLGRCAELGYEPHFRCLRPRNGGRHERSQEGRR